MTEADSSNLDARNSFDASDPARVGARFADGLVGVHAPRDVERARWDARERELTGEVARLSETVARPTGDTADAQAQTAPGLPSGAPTLGSELHADAEMLTLLRAAGMDAAGLRELLGVARMFGQLGRKAA